MENINVCILDYGSGNVRSVYNLIHSLGVNVQITNDPQRLKEATHFVLPGVGAFATAMRKINEKIPLDLVKNRVFNEKIPFLGICVGLQALAEKGFEFGEHDGLGWISGNIEKIDTGNLPLPHIGWNNLSIKKDCKLLENLTEEFDFYFVHSFAFKSKDNTHVIATTDYGKEHIAIIQKDNIYGVQFHPEKSQIAGKIFIKNFLRL